jgi:uncharacterized peroxidase-related enzyme
MARDEERRARAQQPPVVGSLPDLPGITVAMQLTPELGRHMRGLADALLVEDFPGATIGRPEGEMLATAVSAANDCFFCMDSHGAFATELLERAGRTAEVPVIDMLKTGDSDALEPRMRALVHIARVVGRDSLALTAADTQAARDAGASDGDIQLAVLIAAGFSMFNRMVDGFRAMTPPVVEAHHESAVHIASQGYSRPRAAAAS